MSFQFGNCRRSLSLLHRAHFHTITRYESKYLSYFCFQRNDNYVNMKFLSYSTTNRNRYINECTFNDRYIPITAHNIFRKQRISLHYNRYSSSNNKSPETSKKISKSKSTKIAPDPWPTYIINSMTNISKKTLSFLWRLIYATFDSIIHPSNGLERLRSMGKRIVTEFKHYKHGASLMWTDIIQGTKIINKKLNGKEITYRERRQLQRVALDILRMFPFALIVLIPFLEVLLPVILILFPNLLPSRFQHETQKTAKRKRQLQARLGMISFWEETLEKFVEERLKHKSKTEGISHLEELLIKIRNKEEIPNEHIILVASFFNDEITLDNASPTELSNMCQYMLLNTFGTPTMLRMRLRNKIIALRREDKGIKKEGVDNIQLNLLKQLLRERGMRSDFEEWVLRTNLQKWLELSLDNEVPVTLLIMSRIFTLQHIPGHEPTDLLKDTLSNIGEAATQEVLVDRAGVVDPEIEKKVIQRQAKLIAEEAELEEEEKVRDEKKKKKYKLPADDTFVADGGISDVFTIEELDDQQSDVFKEKQKRQNILHMADALETIASDTVLDPERIDLEHYRQKLDRMDDENDEAVVIADDEKRKQFKSIVEESAKEEFMVDPMIDGSVESDSVDEQNRMKFGVQSFDSADDVEDGGESRLITEYRLKNRLSKMIAKAQKEMDGELLKLEKNDSKVFSDTGNISYEEIKQLMNAFLLKSEDWNENDIEIFLKELHEKRRKNEFVNKEGNDGMNFSRHELAKLIQQVIDDYEEDSGSDTD